jgi:hypothetical protein
VKPTLPLKKEKQKRKKTKKRKKTGGRQTERKNIAYLSPELLV